MKLQINLFSIADVLGIALTTTAAPSSIQGDAIFNCWNVDYPSGTYAKELCCADYTQGGSANLTGETCLVAYRATSSWFVCGDGTEIYPAPSLPGAVHPGCCETVSFYRVPCLWRKVCMPTSDLRMYTLGIIH